MTTITTRAGKGAPLTHAEMDANFTNLNTAKLEASDLASYETSAHAASTYLAKSNNLSDLANAATARSNLGVSATGADTTYNVKTANLSDVANVATARSNLGLAIGTDVQAYDANTVKKNTANTFTATQVADNGTASVSTTSTYTFDGADQIREITFTNAITVTFGAPTGITQYAMYKFLLKAGDTSARTFAWNSAYKFPSATAPLTSGTTTNGAYDIITFIGGASNTLIYDGKQSDVR